MIHASDYVFWPKCLQWPVLMGLVCQIQTIGSQRHLVLVILVHMLVWADSMITRSPFRIITTKVRLVMVRMMVMKVVSRPEALLIFQT